MLRKALGENPDLNGTGYIETVPRRGYRFVAPGRVCADPAVEELYTEAVQPDIPAAPAPAVQRDGSKANLSRWRIALWGTVLLVVIALAALLAGPLISRNHTPERSAKSVAVLPFRLLAANSEDEYLSLGLADAIITKLGESRGMRVRPIDEVRQYSGSTVDTLKAGRELAVNALLEGTIQRQGDKVRVNMQLLDAASGASLWADQIDCSFHDMFAIEDRVTAEVERTWLPELTPRVTKASFSPVTVPADARQDYRPLLLE